MQERKLLGIDVKTRQLDLEKAELQFVKESLSQLANSLNFNEIGELRVWRGVILLR